MTSQGQLISFENSALSSKGGLRSKGNGQDVSPDLPISARHCDDAHARRTQPSRALPLSHATYRRGSPQRPGERSRLPPRHVRRGRYRRDAWQASQARRTARGRWSPVSGLVSALLHPPARRASHRTRPGTQLRAMPRLLESCDPDRPRSRLPERNDVSCQQLADSKSQCGGNNSLS